MTLTIAKGHLGSWSCLWHGGHLPNLWRYKITLRSAIVVQEKPLLFSPLSWQLVSNFKAWQWNLSIFRWDPRPWTVCKRAPTDYIQSFRGSYVCNWRDARRLQL